MPAFLHPLPLHLTALSFRSAFTALLLLHGTGAVGVTVSAGSASSSSSSAPPAASPNVSAAAAQAAAASSARPNGSNPSTSASGRSSALAKRRMWWCIAGARGRGQGRMSRQMGESRGCLCHCHALLSDPRIRSFLLCIADDPKAASGAQHLQSLRWTEGGLQRPVRID
jgi:hypothetical protein